MCTQTSNPEFSAQILRTNSLINDNCGDYKSTLSENFLISNQKILLVYSGMLMNKQVLSQHFKEVFLKKYIDKLISIDIAHEQLQSNSLTHVLLVFSSAFRTEKKTYFDISNGTTVMSPYIIILSHPTKHWNSCLEAFIQFDPECEYLRSKLNQNPIKIKADKIHNVVINNNFSLQPVPISFISENKEYNENIDSNSSNSIETIIEKSNLTGHKWQNNLLNELKEQAQNKIIWYLSGENDYYFMREIGIYLKSNYIKEDYLVISQFRDEETFINLICSEIHNHSWNEKILILNLELSLHEQKETEKFTQWLSNCLIIVKLRILVKQDYNKKTIMLNKIPHIIVFSNSDPVLLCKDADKYIEFRKIKENENEIVNYFSIIRYPHFAIEYEFNKETIEQRNLLEYEFKTKLFQGTFIGRLYCLKHVNHNNIFYIGSTTQTLNARLMEHKYAAEGNSTSNVYKYIRKIGTDNIVIILQDEREYISIKDLFRLERDLILRYRSQGYLLCNQILPIKN